MITNYYVLDASFRYVTLPGDTQGMASYLDEVANHLYTLDVEDLNIVADANDSSFVVSLVVGSHSGDSIETILGKGMGTLRTAFHACDASTANWPSMSDMLLGVKIKPTNLITGDTTTEHLLVAS